MNLQIQYDSVDAKAEVAGACLRLSLPLPYLAGAGAEQWPLGGAREDSAAVLRWRSACGWHIAQSDNQLWACALADGADAVLEANIRELYLQLLGILGGYQLQRVWHFIPRINECDASGLERYRAFCRGRSVAFEQFFANTFDAHFPAASAVGCEGGKLVLYACARKGVPTLYLENPLQVPAYRYPQKYGPRAPGFARASVTDVTPAASEMPNGTACDRRECDAAEESKTDVMQAKANGGWREVYISGTASIRESQSLTQGGVIGQLQTTVENLNRIAAEAGIALLLASPSGADAVLAAGIVEPESAQRSDGAGAAQRDSLPNAIRCERRFRVYLRHAKDCAAVAAAFGALLRAGDSVSYVRSDICRAELDIEIEATVLMPIVRAA